MNNGLFNLSNQELSKILTSIENSQSHEGIIISLLVTMGLCAIIYTTYKLSYNSINYNKKFNITLVMLAFISTILMDLIQSNLALSLGMLGSLSIARFRTTVKDTRDIGFIFWSMAIGISSSTGNYFIGLIGSIIMSVFMIVTSKLFKTGDMLLLVIRGKTSNIGEIQSIINKINKSNKVKAKNINSDSYELVYEIKSHNNEDDEIINRVLNLDGVDSVNILAPNTEIAI